MTLHKFRIKFLFSRKMILVIHIYIPMEESACGQKILEKNKIISIYFLPQISHGNRANYILFNLTIVENHRIFCRYSLIYLQPFVYIILLPFTLYFVFFLFHYIYI